MNLLNCVNQTDYMTKGSIKSNVTRLRKKFKISIVEDDLRTSEMLTTLIAKAGHECIGHYPDAESAIKALPTSGSDIVLMDIELPRASGIDCIRKVKTAMPDTQFLIMTTHEDSDLIFDAISTGAVGYLLKRSAPEELDKALSDVMEGGSPITSSIARKVIQAFQSTQEPSKEIGSLSKRERQVLKLLAEGFFYKEIADDLKISQSTVHSYIRRIYDKLHVRSRMEAVAKLQPRWPPSA